MIKRIIILPRVIFYFINTQELHKIHYLKNNVSEIIQL